MNIFRKSELRFVYVKQSDRQTKNTKKLENVTTLCLPVGKRSTYHYG